MQKLFGIPVDTLLLVLLVALAVALGILVFLAARQPVLVKLGIRNVGRRRGRSALIVARADARHDDRRYGADDRRHDEPHDPRDCRADARDRPMS